MRKYVLLGLAFLVALLITGNASAGNTIDTSNIFLMAYYNPGTNIDLSTAIQEFDFVTESTGQYVEGKLRIWYDDPDGRNPGNIQDFERRDNADTTILFASNVTVRVRSDGWIVAWLTNEQNLSDIVFFNDANTGDLPSNTTLGKAIWRITNRTGTNYNKDDLNYYSYKYPAADKLLIGGRVTTTGGETYSFLMPSTITVYDAKILWTAYMRDDLGNIWQSISGKIKMNTTDIYYKATNIDNYYTGLYDYGRYYQDITEKGVRHTIYMESGGSGAPILKSAVAVLYKTG